MLGLGEKGLPSFYFFMFLRMVSGLLPFAISILAICCEYQTSDMFGRFFNSRRYAFCQLAYLASVSSFRASRRALFGV